MKKIMFILFCLICGITVSACGFINDNMGSKRERKTSDASSNVPSISTGNVQSTELYKNYIQELIEKKDKGEFSIRDIDNNGVHEIIKKNDEKYDIYTCKSGEIKMVDSRDFLTGTTQVYASSNPNYPGLFYYYSSGGLDHYGYISIVDGKVDDQIIWDYDYSGISREIGEKRDKTKIYTDDESLVAESKKLYEKSSVLRFYKFEKDSVDKIDELLKK